MDLLSPPAPCTSFFIDRTPQLSLSRRYPSPSIPSPGLSKYGWRVSSELQTTPVSSGNGRAGSYSTSVPTHKVTVHDRQRGVVHEFLVPEVQSLKWIPFNSWEYSLLMAKLLQHFTVCAVLWIVLSHRVSEMQDQYILHTAESQNISLPFACRHGIVLLYHLQLSSGSNYIDRTCAVCLFA